MGEDIPIQRAGGAKKNAEVQKVCVCGEAEWRVEVSKEKEITHVFIFSMGLLPGNERENQDDE